VSGTAAGLTLRPASAADEALLLAWANDPVTRAASRIHDQISAADHHAWLERRLDAPDEARIWIGEVMSAPIGVVRFERRAADAVEVSITVAPDARGRGLAGQLLQAGVTKAREAFGPVTILAEILAGNDASVRLFSGAGFTPVASVDSEASGIIRLERR
jgi:RimJ/RimL family protein N-acetyltransferase